MNTNPNDSKQCQSELRELKGRFTGVDLPPPEDWQKLADYCEMNCRMKTIFTQPSFVHKILEQCAYVIRQQATRTPPALSEDDLRKIIEDTLHDPYIKYKADVIARNRTTKENRDGRILQRVRPIRCCLVEGES